MKRRDHALDRIIEEYGADADAHVELEAVVVREERLVLADGLSLIVEDGPATADPARAEVVGRHHRQAIGSDDNLAIGVARRYRSRLCLDLLLDLAAEAIGIAET